MRKYLGLLYIQVLIGIFLGGIAGYYFPAFTPTARLISDTFINLIKMLITPLIFLTVVLGIAGVGDMKKFGRVGGKGLLYFEMVTTLALLIGLFVANVIQPGKGVATDHLDVSQTAKYAEQAEGMNWAEFFTHIIPSNIFNAF
ncbi:MAG: glutamate/aspartate:proton symporter GltP, partial [Azospira oryzae]